MAELQLSSAAHNVFVRPAEESDAAALAELRVLYLSDQIAKGSRDKPSIEPARLFADSLRLIKRKRTSVLLAMRNNLAVGYLVGQTKILPGVEVTKVASIEEIFVLKRQRRSDFAQRLVRRVLSEFRNAGAARVQLRVLDGNREGKVFWECVGFHSSIVIYEYSNSEFSRLS